MEFGTEEYYREIMQGICREYLDGKMRRLLWCDRLKHYYNAKQGLYRQKAEKADNKRDRKRFEFVVQEAARFATYDLKDTIHIYWERSFPDNR